MYTESPTRVCVWNLAVTKEESMRTDLGIIAVTFVSAMAFGVPAAQQGETPRAGASPPS